MDGWVRAFVTSRLTYRSPILPLLPNTRKEKGRRNMNGWVCVYRWVIGKDKDSPHTHSSPPLGLLTNPSTSYLIWFISPPIWDGEWWLFFTLQNPFPSSTFIMLPHQSISSRSLPKDKRKREGWCFQILNVGEASLGISLIFFCHLSLPSISERP